MQYFEVQLVGPPVFVGGSRPPGSAGSTGDGAFSFFTHNKISLTFARVSQVD
jgi:hypothetical protein